jgi:hypothetical protein
MVAMTMNSAKREARIARLQAEGREFARRVLEHVASRAKQTMFCIHGNFLKRTEVGDALHGIAVHERCQMCTAETENNDTTTKA